MGYRSRVYVVNKQKPMNYADVVARFDCVEMPKDFEKVFAKEFSDRIYSEDGNTWIYLDKYGKKLRCSEFSAVIAWLEKESASNDYRRLKPLLSLLKGFDLTQWGNIQIVHYRY